jgi:hypothetical protein
MRVKVIISLYFSQEEWECDLAKRAVGQTNE